MNFCLVFGSLMTKNTYPTLSVNDCSTYVWVYILYLNMYLCTWLSTIYENPPMSLCMNRSITIPFLSLPPTNDLKNLSKTNTKKNKKTRNNFSQDFFGCPCWMGTDNDPLVPSFSLAPFRTKWWRKNDVQVWLGDYPIMFQHISVYTNFQIYK